MKISYYLLLSISFIFISLQVSAQCTGCTITSDAANGTFNVGTGEKLCLTIDGTFTGTVNLSGTGTLCVSSTTTISNTANLTINNNASIENYGTWNKSFGLQNGQSFLNTGTGTVNMAGDFNNSGSFISDNGSTIIIAGGVNNNGTFQINGGATISGNIENNAGGGMSFGTPTNIAGNFNNSSNTGVTFNGDANISGSFTNNSNATVTANDATITITGNLINNSNATIQAGGSCGRFNVNGQTINNSNGSVGENNVQLDICDASQPNKAAPDFGWDTQNSNTNNFGDNLSFCTCVPTILPITLTTFTAKKEDNNSVAINWKTVFELDNEYFQVERSFTGTNFNVIAQIASQKNNNEPNQERNYSFTDNLTDDITKNDFSQNQTIYYRLKQVDTNGDFSYSPVVSVRVEKQESEKIQVLSLQNEWKFDIQDPIQVNVYSSIGVLKGVYELNQNQNTILVSSFSKGIYILHLQDSKTGKITILKLMK